MGEREDKHVSHRKWKKKRKERKKKKEKRKREKRIKEKKKGKVKEKKKRKRKKRKRRKRKRRKGKKEEADLLHDIFGLSLIEIGNFDDLARPLLVCSELHGLVHPAKVSTVQLTDEPIPRQARDVVVVQRVGQRHSKAER